jgi:type I restriction enzyme S subunit
MVAARQVDPRQTEFAELPHVNGESIESGTCRLLHMETVSDARLISGKYLFEPGDVLYSKLRPYLRKVTVAKFRGLCSADMYPIRVARERIDPQFLAWLLVSEGFTRYAVEESGRARMPKLNREQLFAWNTALPPIDEQRRILAMLGERIEVMERARAAAEAQLAVAKALATAYLRRTFGGRSSQHWPRTPLAEIGEIVSGVTLGRKLGVRETRRVAYLRVANVKDGHLDLSDVYEIDATEAEVVKLHLRPGDLLLTEGGDADKLGRGACWRGEIPECIHQNHIFRVRFDPEHILPEFVSAQVGSPYGKAYFLGHAKQTTGIATINQRVLAAFPLMVPAFHEQERIVAVLDAVKREAERVRQAVETRLSHLRSLPAALLRRAFSGEL